MTRLIIALVDFASLQGLARADDVGAALGRIRSIGFRCCQFPSCFSASFVSAVVFVIADLVFQMPDVVLTSISNLDVYLYWQARASVFDVSRLLTAILLVVAFVLTTFRFPLVVVGPTVLLGIARFVPRVLLVVPRITALFGLLSRPGCR